MPKYYRFRVTSPTRKMKRCRDKEKEKEVEKCLDKPKTCMQECIRVKLDAEMNWLDLTLACSPAPTWYLRRTAWRESPPLMGVPRQLAAGLRASVQLSNRPIFVFKIPTVRSQDWMRLL